jgi:hypothetical protein
VFDNLYSGGSGDGHHSQEINEKAVGGQKLWRGANSTDWATASNWHPTGVPTATDDISIETNNFINMPVLDANRTVASIDFGDASKLIQQGTFSLSVSKGIFNASATQYLQTSSTGSLRRNISNTETFIFPVGNNAYNPVTITNNTGTADEFSVYVTDDVLQDGTTGTALSTSRVNRTWHIGKTNPTANAGAGVTMSFSWDPTEEIGTMAAYRLNHHNGSGWVFATGYGGSEQVSGSNPKTLTFTGYKGGFSPFFISGEAVSPLPIVLKEFTAQCADKQVMLNWITESEINNERFFVQRSADLAQWEQVLTMPGAGNSNAPLSYSATDDRPLGGISYYRLGQQDYDGTTEMFDPVSVVCHATDESAHALRVYPNPAEDAFTIFLNLPQSEQQAELHLTDINGRVAAVYRIKIDEGGNTLQINREQLTSGTYILRLVSESIALPPVKVVLR